MTAATKHGNTYLFVFSSGTPIIIPVRAALAALTIVNNCRGVWYLAIALAREKDAPRYPKATTRTLPFVRSLHTAFAMVLLAFRRPVKY